MSTILYSNVRYYGPHFESMAREWRRLGENTANVFKAVAKYFNDESAKRHLREMPDYLLEDIGVSRYQLR